MTQAELAVLTGTTEGYIRKIEKNQSKPSIEQLVKIMVVLDCKLVAVDQVRYDHADEIECFNPKKTH